MEDYEKTNQTSKKFTDISVGAEPEHRIRFYSDQTICVESLVGDHWSGRYWCADGRIDVPYEAWASDAFQLSLDGQLLTGDWAFTSCSELPQTVRGSRHFVVQLTNTQQPASVAIHTLL